MLCQGDLCIQQSAVIKGQRRWLILAWFYLAAWVLKLVRCVCKLGLSSLTAKNAAIALDDRRHYLIMWFVYILLCSQFYKEAAAGLHGDGYATCC